MLKILSSIAYAGLILSSCLVSSNIYSDGKSRDNYFTVASLSATPIFLSNDSAFSLLVEAGDRSNRVNGTVGVITDEFNRFKVSAEYLSQKLHYKFDTGKVHHWVHQFAFGGAYQHIFACPTRFRALDLGFTYSNAPNKHLSSKTFGISSDSIASPSVTPEIVVVPQVPIESGTLYRNIAGGKSWSVTAGVDMYLWRCASLTPSITYQQVKYTRHHQDKKRLSGVGFDLAFRQRLFKHVSINLNYQFRQAYNDLRASLNWNKIYSRGALGLGIFVDHVYGKRELPTSTTTGFELSYAFGVCDYNSAQSSLQNEYGNNCCSDVYVCSPEDLRDWVSDPAVYMGEVLAISDQQLCMTPSDDFPVSGDENLFNLTSGIQQINLNNYFNVADNSKIDYTVTLPSPLPTGVNNINFDPNSGIITFNLNPDFTTFEVGVVATNACGVEPTSFFVDYEESGE